MCCPVSPGRTPTASSLCRLVWDSSTLAFQIQRPPSLWRLGAGWTSGCPDPGPSGRFRRITCLLTLRARLKTTRELLPASFTDSASNILSRCPLVAADPGMILDQTVAKGGRLADESCPLVDGRLLGPCESRFHKAPIKYAILDFFQEAHEQNMD